MISKYGQTFASEAEIRRFEAVNPETAKLWQAFGAMREALIRLIRFSGNPLTSGDVSRLRFTTTIDGIDVQAARAALALADKVTR